jgi:dTDP-4-amino-4,6-dideoxy-D-galactose acyltransferase
MIQFKSWDSNFFKIKIGEVTNISDKILSQMILENYDLIYIFLKKPNIEASNEFLKETNAKIVDSKVIFKKNISSIEENVNLFEFNSTDSFNQIEKLSLESGHKSRFKLDLNFEKGKFEELYKLWIQKSIEKDEIKVFVYRKNNKLGGFVTVEIKEGIGTIGLIAVDKSLRGHGIGRKLVNQVETFLVKSKVNVLEVATQLDNFGACAFYNNLGFEIKETINIYHLWKKMK